MYTLETPTVQPSATDQLHTLKGILLGIQSDGKVTDSELEELMVWFRANLGQYHSNPFKEIETTIQEAILQPTKRTEIINDLIWLCQQHQEGHPYQNNLKAELQTLSGICHGILADGIIEDTEVFALKQWLEEHQHLTSYYPYDEITSLITDILADDVIDQEERIRLEAYFNEFSRKAINTPELTDKNTQSPVEISGICQANPQITFKGKTFSFTGLSSRGPRSIIKDEVVEHGGKFNNKITDATSYLIVGDNSTPYWAFACYGRKVDEAIELRKNGGNTIIIRESDFWQKIEAQN